MYNLYKKNNNELRLPISSRKKRISRMMSVTVVPGLTSTIDDLIARQDKIKQDNIMFTFVYLPYKNSRI